MDRFRGRTSIIVLILSALLSSACDNQAPSEAAPTAAAPDVIETAVAPPATTSADSPSTSAGAAPTTAPATTQPAAVSPSGGASDGTDAVDEEADDPPTGEPDSESSQTDAKMHEEEQIATAIEISLAASFPDRAFSLQPETARGDLNDDGIDDYVLHVIEETSGLPPTNWLVPAVDVGGAFRLRDPIELGQRIIVETVDIRDGNIEISLFDRSPYEQPTVITRRTTLTVSMDDAGDAVTAVRVEPVRNVPSLQIARLPTPVRFELDGIGTAMADRIGLRERHPYVVHASADDVVVATLNAPAGVWLEARLDDDIVLVPVAEQTQRFASRLPAGGAWSITVASSLIETASYRLSIEILGAELSERIATRDLNGFWSGTPISPPTVPDDGHVVYLTFDDGPHPTYTPQVLDVLARHGVQATFFVVGALAEQYPLLIQRIAHEGHTLANHSWRHESLARVSRAAFDRSIGRTQEVLGPLATPCLRPPYWAVGTYTQQWAADFGLKLISWSYSPQDWLGPPAKTIADGLVNRSKPGAVILLHDGGGHRSTTVRGLDMALERLADSGLEFKPICR